MKISRRSVVRQARSFPNIKFESQSLTSFSGLVLFQIFFTAGGLKQRLAGCMRSMQGNKVYARSTIFMQLIVHFLIGFRSLRQAGWYRHDPLVKRVLGLRRLPDAATISRTLGQADETSIKRLRAMQRQMVLERVAVLGVSRITLDFDGSVQSTGRRAEGTAVGFNKKKKGARSYYPLFCTIAQTGQVLDFLHRGGNVHDSRGARAFMIACIEAVRETLPGVIIEVRADSAFFSDELVQVLRGHRTEFTLSVPFERFTELKGRIESRRRWHRLNGSVSYFEASWKPKSWEQPQRFLFIRTKVKKQQKGMVQLDLFEPYDHAHDFKVIITNKDAGCKSVLKFHEGRGAQEGIFADLKTDCHMGHVPVNTRGGNQMYLLAGLMAHNLVRELQMQTSKPSRRNTPNRAALWTFEKMSTLRHGLIARAGRLTRPAGCLTLTISGGALANAKFSKIIAALRPAA